MNLKLTLFFALLTTLSYAQSITNLQSDTLNIDELMYTQQISLDGLFDDNTELEISHYNVLEGDTINSFVELIDFSELDIDPFLTFSHDTSLNTLVFSIGEFEISNNYTKLIYRRTGQADEEYILQ